MKKIILSVALAMLPLSAQTQNIPNVKLVPLRYISTHAANDMLAPFRGIPGLRVDRSDHARLVAISGTPEMIAAVEDYIKKFDVPPPEPPKSAPQKNVEVTAYMLVGSNEPDSADQALVAELAPVVKQLRAVFPFKSYRLVETMIVRGREHNPGEATGLMAMQGTGDAARAFYTFKYANAVIVPEDRGRTIRLDRVRVGARIPMVGANSQIQYADTGVSTDVDLREGQKVVVGKTSVGPGQTSLFLVMTAKVVE